VHTMMRARAVLPLLVLGGLQGTALSFKSDRPQGKSRGLAVNNSRPRQGPYESYGEYDYYDADEEDSDYDGQDSDTYDAVASHRTNITHSRWLTAIAAVVVEETDDCTKKLAAFDAYDEAFGISDVTPTTQNKDYLFINVGAKKGKKGGTTCPRGKCCSTMANPTKMRCNLAVREVTAQGSDKGKMQLCHWDETREGDNKCKGTFRRFNKTDPTNPCQIISATKRNMKGEIKLWPDLQADFPFIGGVDSPPRPPRPPPPPSPPPPPAPPYPPPSQCTTYLATKVNLRGLDPQVWCGGATNCLGSYVREEWGDTDNIIPCKFNTGGSCVSDNANKFYCPLMPPSPPPPPCPEICCPGAIALCQACQNCMDEKTYCDQIGCPGGNYNDRNPDCTVGCCGALGYFSASETCD